MLSEIRDEVSHVMVIIVLIFCIVASSVTYNKKALFEDRYANWVFNTDCDSGTGFVDAMIMPENP
jgi:hypothetical protein